LCRLLLISQVKKWEVVGYPLRGNPNLVKLAKLKELKHIANMAMLADIVDEIDKETEIPEDWEIEIMAQANIQKRQPQKQIEEAKERIREADEQLRTLSLSLLSS
jgi:hypothetical protein